MEAVKTQLLTTRIAARCGRIRTDNSRCRTRWFLLWISQLGAVEFVQPNWERSSGRRPEGGPGVWWEGLLHGPDGFLEERPRWNVRCSRHCGASYQVTQAGLEALVRDAVAEHRSTIWLADLT